MGILHACIRKTKSTPPRNNTAPSQFQQTKEGVVAKQEGKRDTRVKRQQCQKEGRRTITYQPEQDADQQLQQVSDPVSIYATCVMADRDTRDSAHEHIYRRFDHDFGRV
jgi:hypothetical protein